MKHLLMSIAILASSMAVQAAETIKAENDREYGILSRVIGSKFTYSQTSNVGVRVIELIGGDGAYNNSRLAVVIEDGTTQKVYMLDRVFARSLERVTFLAKDLIVVNYMQDSFEGENADKEVILRSSVTIKVKRNSDGSLADTIEIK